MVIYSQTRLRGFVDEYSSDPQIKEMMSDSQRYSFNLYLKNNKEDVAMFQTLKKTYIFFVVSSAKVRMPMYRLQRNFNRK